MCQGAEFNGGLHPITDGLVNGGVAASLEAAMIECHAQGGRLCTAEEANTCCSRGCNIDNVLMWTSTPCAMAPTLPPSPPLRPPPPLDVVLNDDASHLSGDEVLIRFAEPPAGVVGVWEVRLLGREAGVVLPNVITIDPPLKRTTMGGNSTVRGKFSFELAAEVVNLERNVLITGPHAQFEKSTRGLHVIGAFAGVVRITHTRVEWCGQSSATPPLGTGVTGRYCLHLHHLSHCPDCLLEGNAVEHGIEKGVTLHDTHDALIHRNVVWTLRGAGFYVEDGNEINNTISENVASCGDMPGVWNRGLRECKMPGVHAGGVGFYIIGMSNNYLHNRASGYETGLYTNGGSHGNGPARGLSCPIFTPFRRMEGNVMHHNTRWGLYLGNQQARNVVQVPPAEWLLPCTPFRPPHHPLLRLLAALASLLTALTTCWFLAYHAVFP